MYNILIVEDEQLMSDALKVLIGKVEGFRVLDAVNSGEEAVKLCSQTPVHIVFMDLALPGITGIEASEQIEKINPSTEIIVVSALSSYHVVKKALSSSVRSYLTKPVSFSEIRDLLTAYQDRQKKEKSHSEKLVELVQDSQYDKVADVVSETVGEVFLENGSDSRKVENSLRQIAGNILSEVSRTDLADERGILEETDVLQKYPIKESQKKEKAAWVFWLSDIMEDAFRIRMTSGYDYLWKVFEYVDDRINSFVNLSDICDACSISQSYLSKLFRRYCGISVMDYIHLRKLMRAKQYIEFTDMSLTEIGHKMGYNDGSYFSKVFKKYEGITPKQYKQQRIKT